MGKMHKDKQQPAITELIAGSAVKGAIVAGILIDLLIVSLELYVSVDFSRKLVFSCHLIGFLGFL